MDGQANMVVDQDEKPPDDVLDLLWLTESFVHGW